RWPRPGHNAEGRHEPALLFRSPLRSAMRPSAQSPLTSAAILSSCAMASRSIPKTAPRRCRVLYVEDDAESLALVEELIAGRKDLVLLRAADIELAMKVARRERPEVIMANSIMAAPGAARLGRSVAAARQSQ